ncbi:MAG: site-specific DNA-methyltransferase, partial [Roseovarius sp.]|nr:site-specific DNA-methyltransferase [Roseovarius sp.]
MSSSLRDLIVANLPEDGSAIGNMTLLALLREQVPELTDEAFGAAKNSMITEGLLGKGRGRGGSVFLLSFDDEDDAENETEDNDFALEAEEPVGPSARKVGVKKKAARKAQGPVQVLSYRHTETRVNNPEVGMVHPENDPDQPKTVWKYDPHLDPALMFDSQRGAVEKLIDDALGSGDANAMRDALEELKRLQTPYLNWAGKAEGTSFAVDTVSLHVHERVDPATILANARKRLKGEKAGEAWRQADLFAAAFENLPLRQALDFYHHEKGWSNRLIAGDSLLVMNSLLQKESMAGKVQMIYIDPPYGIKYGSNFQPFVGQKKVSDSDKDEDLNQEPEMIKAFRDTWELGIHSYLTYLRDRLLLARDLLHETGSVFIQMGDQNVHHARTLMDEVLGAQNFVALIYFQTAANQNTNRIQRLYDCLVWYKGSGKLKYNDLFRVRDQSETDATFTAFDPLLGEKYKPAQLKSDNGYDRLLRAGRLTTDGAYWKRYVKDFPYVRYDNVWRGTVESTFSKDKVYVVQTNRNVVERCVLMTTDPGDLVLDPTCGSGTTAYASEKWGRRWITCDTSRIAITLAKQRLMTASFDYYRLRYPHEGLAGGFDYRSEPHITLTSIIENPDIDIICDEQHPLVGNALDKLNDALEAAPPASFKPSQGKRKGKQIDFGRGDRLLEDELPFEAPDDWSETATKLLDAYHSALRNMRQAIERSISDHATLTPLYDQPRVDDTRLRITGPFSVEAVPAPTVLSLDESGLPEQADATVARSGETSRQTQWRDELIRTGIRAKGGAMLKFTDLEAIPGVKHLHASGTLDTGERVVVSFGPEHAALEQRQVEKALSEAETLRPAPKFIVFCAFTFDPEAAKDIDEINWPGVTLLKAQMNTDLLTEDLKKARSSNQSFWLMGQPEVELRSVGEAWQVEVHGFDYFDPREGT